MPALTLQSPDGTLHTPHSLLTPLLLLQTFSRVWDNLPSAHASLRKLCLTWSGVFPLPALEAVQRAHNLVVGSLPPCQARVLGVVCYFAHTTLQAENPAVDTAVRE